LCGLTINDGSMDRWIDRNYNDAFSDAFSNAFSGVFSDELVVVMGDDFNDFSCCIKLHPFPRLNSILVDVVKNKTRNSPHHIHEFKVKIWIGFESFFEIVG
jgi:hypothetical protein